MPAIHNADTGGDRLLLLFLPAALCIKRTCPGHTALSCGQHEELHYCKPASVTSRVQLPSNWLFGSDHMTTSPLQVGTLTALWMSFFFVFRVFNNETTTLNVTVRTEQTSTPLYAGFEWTWTHDNRWVDSFAQLKATCCCFCCLALSATLCLLSKL